MKGTSNAADRQRPDVAETALRFAIDNQPAGAASADDLVSDAGKFHEFLTNAKTEGK